VSRQVDAERGDARRESRPGGARVKQCGELRMSARVCHPEAKPRRTRPLTMPRGPKDLIADTYQPGRGSGHQCRGLGCRGALTRPRLCSSTLSHKQRGRGGTLQDRARGNWVWCLGRRPPSPTLPPQTARGKGASVVRGASRRAIQVSPSPAQRGKGAGGRGLPEACAGGRSNPARSSPLSRRSLPGEGPGEGPDGAGEGPDGAGEGELAQ
jgi:hypothetical protein